MSEPPFPADHHQPAMVWRRNFLRVMAGGTAGLGGRGRLAAWSVLSALGPAARASASRPRGPAARTVSFDAGWLFGSASAGSDQPGFDDSAFVSVTLPHTVAPLSWQNWDPSAWEQVWAYRKYFDAPPGPSDMRVFR